MEDLEAINDQLEADQEIKAHYDELQVVTGGQDNVVDMVITSEETTNHDSSNNEPIIYNFCNNQTTNYNFCNNEPIICDSSNNEPTIYDSSNNGIIIYNFDVSNNQAINHNFDVSNNQPIINYDQNIENNQVSSRINILSNEIVVFAENFTVSNITNSPVNCIDENIELNEDEVISNSESELMRLIQNKNHFSKSIVQSDVNFIVKYKKQKRWHLSSIPKNLVNMSILENFKIIDKESDDLICSINNELSLLHGYYGSVFTKYRERKNPFHHKYIQFRENLSGIFLSTKIEYIDMKILKKVLKPSRSAYYLLVIGIPKGAIYLKSRNLNYLKIHSSSVRIEKDEYLILSPEYLDVIRKIYITKDIAKPQIWKLSYIHYNIKHTKHLAVGRYQNLLDHHYVFLTH